MTINAPHDGAATGFSASELLLAGVGSCSAWDVVEILRKQRQRVSTIEVRVEGDQAADPPWAYEHVRLHYTVTGQRLNVSKVRKAVELSERRYCTVIATIRGVAEVTCLVEVREAVAEGGADRRPTVAPSRRLSRSTPPKQQSPTRPPDHERSPDHAMTQPSTDAPGRRSVFARTGSFVVRHRRAVVVCWLVAVVAALPFAPRAGSALQAGGFTSDTLEAAQARKVLVDALGLAPSQLAIVLQSETDARAGDVAFEAAVAAVIHDVPSAAHVVGVLPHTVSPRQVSADGRTVYEVVELDLSPDDSPDALAPVSAALHSVPGVRALLAGGPAFYGDIQSVSERDLQRAELISLPLAAVALLLVFGSVVAAGVPLVVGGAAVVVALATIFVLATLTPMSIFVLNLATLLGLGLGVDYSLLMTSRFREELARLGGGRRADGSVDQEAVDAAVVATVATAGRAVFFSGLTVLLGLCGLLLFEFMILRSVGIAGAIVVGMAALAALTLLPAGLGLLGPRLERLSIPRRGRPRSRASAHRARRRACPTQPYRAGPPLPVAGSGSPSASWTIPGASSCPRSACCSCSACPSSMCASMRRTPRSCRPTCRRGRPTRSSPGSSARASSRPSSWPSGPTGRPPRPATSGCSSTGADAWRSIRGSGASTRSWTSTHASRRPSTSSSTDRRPGSRTDSRQRLWRRRPAAT